MHAWKDLFSTDYGLMSVAVIVVMLVGMVGIARYVAKHVREDCERHDKLGQGQH
ncbi:MAG: DUF3149 domain-containing protein [Pseudomonadota bacterium]